MGGGERERKKDEEREKGVEVGVVVQLPLMR